MAKRVCTLRHARIAAACIAGAAVIVCMPTYLMYRPIRTSTDTAANRINSSFGLAVGYNVEIPENLSVTVIVDDENRGQQVNGGAGGSGQWTVKNFLVPTLETVNFWMYGVALKTPI